MRTPPLLLGAALLFWGWQTNFLIPACIMAVVLEAARFVRERWEFSDDDFSRIWTFCTLLFLAAAIYAFTDNGGPSHFSQLFQHPNFSTQGRAGMASARTAAAMLRWLPMVLFLFVAAQAYSSREEIPATTMSLILRRRWKKAEQLGRPLPPPRGVNVGYPYFATCLFAASMHGSEDNSFFWGLCVLIPWALWSHRSRRFGIAVWAATLALVFAAGYFGQHGISQLQNYVQNMDTQWLSRLMHRGVDPRQSRTMIGQIGRAQLSGRILIRLEPKDGSSAPAYLREASYRVFTSPVWYAGSSKDDFANIQPTIANGTSYVLLSKLNTNRVNIACYLNDVSRETGEPVGLLPLPSGVGELDNLPAYILKRNSAGAVLAEGPGLVIFDALYGPGATIDSAPDTNEDLRVPEREAPALDKVLSELQLDGRSTEEKLHAVQAYFQNKFTYSSWQSSRGPTTAQTPSTPGELDSYTGAMTLRRRRGARSAAPGETSLSRFLLRTRSGHCEYFATAAVLLLREMNIPARYAVGYAVHEKSGKGYVVRERDGHAWCLAWNKETGMWEDFDTTPASWIAEEARRASPFQWLSDSWSWLQFQFSKFRWGQSQWRQYLLLTMVPALVVLLVQIFLRRKRSKRANDKTPDAPVAWPGSDSEFYRIEKLLAARGIVRKSSEPLADWLLRALANPGLSEMRPALLTVLNLHYRYRFDPRSLDSVERAKLKSESQACLIRLAGRDS